jgi:hypothetical protein
VNQNSNVNKSPEGRVRRSPLTRKGKLTVRGQDPNFVYRFVNDTDDRIADFVDQGYEAVPDDSVQVGDKRVNSASSVGSAKRVPVGRGFHAILMRKRRDWYDEDRKAQEEFTNQQESAIHRKAAEGSDYGSVKVERN